MAKPHIDEVFAAIHTFQNACTTAQQRLNGKWAEIDAKVREAKEVLKAKFDQLGIGDHIDWGK